ncbi:hypothetical protein PR202_gb13488 [Eleusine coracana subsp. coracana]|uniref:CXE carboxylesterase n=1 Tax=Eleusine coracana subsp. coracana TaxID=191504 RepID=A0AAV5ETX2_ELECO|nr:hypothetical protein PR202_gb13488 [Eleusine coracana subsp. coracana]
MAGRIINKFSKHRAPRSLSLVLSGEEKGESLVASALSKTPKRDPPLDTVRHGRGRGGAWWSVRRRGRSEASRGARVSPSRRRGTCDGRDGTINRRLVSLLDPSVAASPTPRNGVASRDIIITDPTVPPLPVVVFFHGGGFAYLSASSPSYDAAAVLSVHYRRSPETRSPPPTTTASPTHPTTPFPFRRSTQPAASS